MGAGAGELAAGLVGKLVKPKGVAEVLPSIPAEPPQQTRDDAAEGGKRDTMSRLPKNWRDRVWDAATKRKKTRPGRLPEALAILWATGLRPAELEKGVSYGVYKGRLVFKVIGAKVGLIDNGNGVYERGIPERIIFVDPNLHQGTKYLYEIALAEKKPKTFSYNKTSLRNRVNEIGREVLSKLKDAPSISPYSFRHAMCSDLKSCDQLTDQDRAKVMGHLSVESLESYGRRRRGGGGVSPILDVKTPVEPHGTFSHGPPANSDPGWSGVDGHDVKSKKIRPK